MEYTEGKSGMGLGDVGLGEGADALADGGEAVAAGGRKVLEEVEGGEGIGVAGGDLGRCGVAEKIRDEDNEAADEGRVGVGVEAEFAGAEFGGEPDGGDATEHAVGLGAFRGWERRHATGAVHDEAQAFLDIVDGGEILDEGG